MVGGPGGRAMAESSADPRADRGGGGRPVPVRRAKMPAAPAPRNTYFQVFIRSYFAVGPAREPLTRTGDAFIRRRVRDEGAGAPGPLTGAGVPGGRSGNRGRDAEAISMVRDTSIWIWP